jgi:hypothetical protein
MSITIPNLHNSSKSRISGNAEVFISARQGVGLPGTFKVEINVNFDPAGMDYPFGTLTISTNLSDSINSLYTGSTIELINSYGKDTPIAYVVGRCKPNDVVGAATPIGCKYWIMLANNKQPAQQQTPDIIAFAITDRNNVRVSYGAGPVRSGDILVAFPGV